MGASFNNCQRHEWGTSALAGFLGGIIAVSTWRFYENQIQWRLVARKRQLAIEKGSPELEKMVSGELYVPAEKTLTVMLQTAHALCEEYNAPNCSVEKRTNIISRLLGNDQYSDRKDLIRDNSQQSEKLSSPYIEPPFYCDYGFNINVGSNFYANFGCVLLDCAKITIGDNCFLAPGVKLYTATHPLDAIQRRKAEFAQKITIGNDVWIGGDAIICPGCTIGSRVTIAAGSVVTKDVPDDVLVAGIPATIKKHIQSKAS